MKREQDRSGAKDACCFWKLFLLGLVFCAGAFPGNVFAGAILGAELRLTYEDNVVGLLSDQQARSAATGGASGGMMAAAGPGGMGSGNNRYLGSGSGSTQSPGDYSATLYAEAGGYRDVTNDTSLYAKGFAERRSYNTYTDLNATVVGVNVGVNTYFTDIISARAAVIGKLKRFGDSERDSTAYSGTLALKEKLTTSFWLREFGEYEKNRADIPAFSYTGMKVGAEAGYSLFRETILTAGYSYLDQTFDEPADAELKTRTVFATAEQTLGKHWALAGEYDLQASRESVTETSTTNNVFSLALRYSY